MASDCEGLDTEEDFPTPGFLITFFGPFEALFWFLRGSDLNFAVLRLTRGGPRPLPLLDIERFVFVDMAPQTFFPMIVFLRVDEMKGTLLPSLL